MEPPGATESTAREAGHTRRWWLPQTALSWQDRRRVLGSLYPSPDDLTHWWFRFGVMMALSVVVAVMGLSTDSGAIVIGAMLIAPLMTPVLGVSAALVMTWWHRLGHAALAVLAGSAGAIGLAWALTAVLPSADRQLTVEFLSRTSPDLRDLLVAVAAGAAGAYATTREDVSAALPGVAVAVALVPPLAAVGFALAIGRSDLAEGALLLYLANLVAIILVGAVVFLGTGFVPRLQLRRAGVAIGLGLFVLALATAGVAVPLAANSLGAITHTRTTQAIDQAVVKWLSPYPGMNASTINVQGTQVSIDVVGSQSPPSTASLAAALESILGPTAAVQVRWFQSVQGAQKQKSATNSLSQSELRSLVERWLGNETSGIQVVSVTMSGNSTKVDLVGSSPPPSAGPLAQAISKQVGRPISISVDWSMGYFETAQSGSSGKSNLQTLTASVRAAVQRWTVSHPGVDLLHVGATSTQISVDLAATDSSEIVDLRHTLTSQFGSTAKIVLRFAQLAVLPS